MTPMWRRIIGNMLSWCPSGDEKHTKKLKSEQLVLLFGEIQISSF